MTAASPARSAPSGAPGVPPRLEVRDLAFRHGARAVLDGASFDVAPGEILGLLGPNGAGKSTLFSVLAGLRPPAAGALRVDGAPVAFGARALRARMGVVFQAPSLDAKLTCRENLALAARLFGVGGAAARARADELLAAAGLADRARDAAGTLSGGLQRRLELARALAHRPDLLLLDEPTTGLDAAAFRQAWATLQALRRAQGLTVLLTTHRPDEAEGCDRLAVLAGGRVVACDTPEALRAQVKGDVVEITAEDPGPLAAAITARLGLPARAAGHAVHVERERGHELVPRLVEAFPAGRFQAIALRRPTLADAFLHLTGQTLEEDAA